MIVIISFLNTLHGSAANFNSHKKCHLLEMKRDFLCVSAINTICRLFVLQLKIVQQQTKFINIERIAFCFAQRCKKKVHFNALINMHLPNR